MIPLRAGKWSGGKCSSKKYAREASDQAKGYWVAYSSVAKTTQGCFEICIGNDACVGAEVQLGSYCKLWRVMPTHSKPSMQYHKCYVKPKAAYHFVRPGVC